MVVNSVVQMIVDREHVGASNREVLRSLVTSVKGGLRGWQKIDRRLRHQFMRQAIYAHGENLAMYCYVMGGR